MAQTRSVGRVSVRVMPDTSKFKQDLSKALNRLERTLQVNIPVGLDNQQLRAQAVAARKAAEREAGRVLLNIDTNTRSATTELDQAARDRTAEITPEVDRSALARVRRQLASLSRAGAGIGGRAVGGSAAVGGLSAVAGGAAVAAGQVVQLAAALAPVAGLVAALPAVAASAGAALGTLRVATTGMGDAFSAAFGDAEEFADALEGLSPAAQGVAREFRSLAPALTDLQQTVQEQFFAPLAGQLTELGQRLLPQLTAGMADVSASMGTAASEIATFAGSAQSVSFLDGLFASTADAIDGARSGLTPFLAGLTAIGTAGLPYVEALGAAFGSLGERFGEWATEAAEAGRVTEWIDQAIATFQQLGDIVGNVGGIIGSVFSGAGDGGILTTLETLTGALDDFFASAQGQEALSGLFEGLGSIGSALAPVITALASGIGTLAPAIGRIAEAIGPVLTRAVEGLVPALQALEPGITAVIGALGDGIDALVSSGALEQLGTALSEILTALSPLLPVLGELAATVLTMLADLLIAIAPSLELLATSLADALAPVLPDLAEAFGELVEAIAPLIPALVEALVPILPILPPLLELVATVLGVVTETITTLSPVIEFLITVIGWLVTIIATVIGWIIKIITWLVKFNTSGKEVSEAFWSAIGAMKDKVAGFLSDLLSSGREKISGLVSTVKGIPGKIRSAVGNLGSLLKGAGRRVIQGLIDGIKGMVSSVGSAMSNIASTIRSYLPFSPAKAGPLRVDPPDQAGRTIAEMIADGLAAGEAVVSAAMTGVAGAASLDLATGEIAVSGSGGGAQVVVQGDGLDRALLEWLRRAIRVQGGNVQAVLGQ